jgi:uncharacterized membrane protein YagU involved in acid resistance
VDWRKVDLKIIVSFIAGVLVCGLIVFGSNAVLPTRADEDTSDNTSGDIWQNPVDLLPDIESIYKKSLTMPFVKAESKITDEDIAEYYSELMEQTGLLPAED